MGSSDRYRVRLADPGSADTGFFSAGFFSAGFFSAAAASFFNFSLLPPPNTNSFAFCTFIRCWSKLAYICRSWNTIAMHCCSRVSSAFVTSSDKFPSVSMRRFIFSIPFGLRMQILINPDLATSSPILTMTSSASFGEEAITSGP